MTDIAHPVTTDLPLLENLNPEQRAAVTLPAVSALVLAGAGSGKTRVLTTRIAWLIRTGQASPAGILAVTFTNKAAREIATRIGALLALDTRAMWLGTFHGLANRLLRTHHKDAALPATFQILDAQDQLGFIKRLLRSLNVDEERYPPKQLMHFINAAKEQGLRADVVPTRNDFERRLAEFFAHYDAQCQREGGVDFAELLLRTFELLSRNVALRTHYQARFRHILVDEFQDTNALQYRLIQLLAGFGTAEPAAVFAVGDDDQSIYAFRGAEVANMRAFEREFAQDNVIKLEQNYRSCAHILDCANHLIAHNADRLGKNLRTDAGHGEPVRIFEAASDMQEAQWLVEMVKEATASGHLRRDIAVLYRSNAQSRTLESALFSVGVPYQVYGGLRYFQRAEIKHALAYLQLLDNPDNDTAFLRVANFPARGIGAKALESVQDTAGIRGSSFMSAAPHVAGRSGSALLAFTRLIAELRAQCATLSLSETVARMLAASGLMAHYKAEKDGAERVENLEQLVDAAIQFCADNRFDVDAPAFFGPAMETTALTQEDAVLDADAPLALTLSPLSAFLSHASLEAGDHQAHADEDALQLMTIHAAKGLEFDMVFVTGLEEGLFPHENSRHDPSGMEEERRLMYVAITRARKQLYLSLAQTRMLHGQMRYNARSQFFAELPEDSLKWLTAKPRANAFSPAPLAAWMEPTPAFAEPHDARWRSGEAVWHAKFGEGVIVALEGGPDSTRARIKFNRHGEKLLDLGVAKLEKIEG